MFLTLFYFFIFVFLTTSLSSSILGLWFWAFCFHFYAILLLIPNKILGLLAILFIMLPLAPTYQIFSLQRRRIDIPNSSWESFNVFSNEISQIHHYDFFFHHNNFLSSDVQTFVEPFTGTHDSLKERLDIYHKYIGQKTSIYTDYIALKTFSNLYLKNEQTSSLIQKYKFYDEFPLLPHGFDFLESSSLEEYTDFNISLPEFLSKDAGAIIWELKPDIFKPKWISKLKRWERSWREHYPFAHFWESSKNLSKKKKKHKRNMDYVLGTTFQTFVHANTLKTKLYLKYFLAINDLSIEEGRVFWYNWLRVPFLGSSIIQLPYKLHIQRKNLYPDWWKSIKRPPLLDLFIIPGLKSRFKYAKRKRKEKIKLLSPHVKGQRLITFLETFHHDFEGCHLQYDFSTYRDLDSEAYPTNTAFFHCYRNWEQNPDSISFRDPFSKSFPNLSRISLAKNTYSILFQDLPLLTGRYMFLTGLFSSLYFRNLREKALFLYNGYKSFFEITFYSYFLERLGYFIFKSIGFNLNRVSRYKFSINKIFNKTEQNPSVFFNKKEQQLIKQSQQRDLRQIFYYYTGTLLPSRTNEFGPDWLKIRAIGKDTDTDLEDRHEFAFAFAPLPWDYEEDRYTVLSTELIHLKWNHYLAYPNMDYHKNNPLFEYEYLVEGTDLFEDSMGDPFINNGISPLFEIFTVIFVFLFLFNLSLPIFLLLIISLLSILMFFLRDTRSFEMIDTYQLGGIHELLNLINIPYIHFTRHGGFSYPLDENDNIVNFTTVGEHNHEDEGDYDGILPNMFDQIFFMIEHEIDDIMWWDSEEIKEVDWYRSNKIKPFSKRPLLTYLNIFYDVEEEKDYTILPDFDMIDEGDIDGYMEDLFITGYVDAGEDFYPLFDHDGAFNSFPEFAPIYTPELTEPSALARFKNPFIGWSHRIIHTFLTIPLVILNFFLVPPLKRTGQEHFDDSLRPQLEGVQDDFFLEEPLLTVGQISDYFDDEEDIDIEDEYYEEVFSDDLDDFGELFMYDSHTILDSEYRLYGGQSARELRFWFLEEGVLDLIHDWEEEDLPGFDDNVYELQWLDEDEPEEQPSSFLYQNTLTLYNYYNQLSFFKMLYSFSLLFFNFSSTEIIKLYSFLYPYSK